MFERIGLLQRGAVRYNVMEKKAIYLECCSGISGDMTVAALLDLGADENVLRDVLKSLPLSGYEIRTSRVTKSGIAAYDFDVLLENDSHDHDMEYLHGHEHYEHDHHEHDHDHHDHDHHDHDHHDHGHHDHDHHEHDHHAHPHEHRGLREITEIINAGSMTAGAREMALKIFRILAQAEAKAHNVPVDQVHFHEVGAVDSIVDIVSAAVCLDNLGADEVIVSPLTEGSGTVRCQHGILPVPVPAVANIAASENLSLRISPVRGELVTPTGAAVAAAFRTSEKLPENFHIIKTGLGAGKREYECPGILRAMLIGYEDEKEGAGTIVKMETNIDDCTGEILGYTLQKLMEQGALDAFFQPVFMKKNRPGWLLTVICNENDREKLEEIIFSETTTIGIRRNYMERTVLKREIVPVETDFGLVRAKRSENGASVRYYPEYEDAEAISRRTGVPLRDVYEAFRRSCPK